TNLNSVVEPLNPLTKNDQDYDYNRHRDQCRHLGRKECENENRYVEHSEECPEYFDQKKRSTTVSLLQPQLLIGQVEGAARHQSPKERSGNCKRKYQTDNILG